MWVVGSKVLDQEVNMFTKRGLSWGEFHVTSKTRTQVEVYLRERWRSIPRGRCTRGKSKCRVRTCKFLVNIEW